MLKNTFLPYSTDTYIQPRTMLLLMQLSCFFFEIATTHSAPNDAPRDKIAGDSKDALIVALAYLKAVPPTDDEWGSYIKKSKKRNERRDGRTK